MYKIDKILGAIGATALVTIVTIAGLSYSDDSKDTKAKRTWTTEDSKSYAKDSVNAWAHKQYVCLTKLWGKESAWNHTALNPEKVMGKNAGGIPQLLGLSPLTPPTIQIDRGLDYIYHRYQTPCNAWAFHKKNRWY
jgi:hypothetical protein